MITNELKKKLGLYSLASGAMALAAGNAGAQVTYADINPDVTVNTSPGSYMLDLNGDATDDFSITIGAFGPYKALYINPLGTNGNAILSVGSSGGSYQAIPLASGAAIPGTPATGDIWGASALMMASYGTGGYGNFKNVSDKYIGLRLRTGTTGNYNYTYGWVRVSTTFTVSTHTISVTIKDKAYNATTNYTLTAGQKTGSGTTTGIQSQELTNNTQVFVNGQNEVTIVNNTAQSLSTQLMDINGNVISTKDAASGLSLLSSGHLAPGMYIVKMMTGDAMASKKVFIQ